MPVATEVIGAAIESLTSEQLLRFLTKQRWFGAKGHAPEAAAIADWMPLAHAPVSIAVARVRVETSGGPFVYQVPLAARECLLADIPDAALVSTVARDYLTIYVVDAVHDPAFRALLAGAVKTGIAAKSQLGASWVVEAAPAAADLPSDATARLAGAEQSNTSIVIGNRAIVKLFRRLAPGVNPDVEVTRFLTTRARFAHTPAFLGELRFQDATGPTTAGMTQQFVPGATDLWTYALERGRPYFVAPDGRDEPNHFLAEAKALGRVTCEMHAALASRSDDPAFAPEPATRNDVDRWAQHTHQAIRESLALLERQLASAEFPEARLAEAQTLVRRRDHYLAFVSELSDSLDEPLGIRSRIHGDFHLGQVLRAPDGALTIIDFEGQPSSPLDERREKTSPLRDVAGMLRSFAYAAATLATAEAAKIQPDLRELRAGRWERDVRNAFLEGYFANAATATSRRMVTLFETEKVFYELSYELNHRPTWAWIPMRGISKLLVR